MANRPTTNRRMDDTNRLFPPNGRWHTVFKDGREAVVDGRWPASTTRPAGPDRTVRTNV